MHKLIAITALIMLSLAATSTATYAQSSRTDALIRFAHFGVDLPAVDVYVDGELSAASGLARWEISSWYALPIGIYNFAFVPAGQPLDTAFTSVSVDLTPESWITVSVIGAEQRGTIRAYSIRDRMGDLPFGEARLSIFHAIEGWDAVDLYANDNALLQFLNYPGTFTDSADRPNDGYVHLDIIANRYDMQIVDHRTQTLQLDLGRVTLVPNYSHLIALIGTPDNPNYTIVLTNRRDRDRFLENSLYLTPSEADTGRLRVAHFSSGTPAMDIYIDNRISIIREISFAEISPFITLPVGTYRIDITPAGLPVQDAVAETIRVDIGPDTWTTVAFIGTLLNDTLRLHALREDFSPVAPGETRISLLHVNPEFGAVDVLLPNGTPLARLLAYPGSFGDNTGFAILDVIAGPYELDLVSSSNVARIILDLPEIRFLEGRNTLLALIKADPPYFVTFTGIPSQAVRENSSAPDEIGEEEESETDQTTSQNNNSPQQTIALIQKRCPTTAARSKPVLCSE